MDGLLISQQFLANWRMRIEGVGKSGSESEANALLQSSKVGFTAF
jgi:hypothetical protein